jgi:phosphatidylinositol alpha-mannosyltransferase
MRIGLVCPYNIGRNGGVQECVLALQQEMLRKGHEVYILTPQFKEGAKRGQNVIELGRGTDVNSFHTTAQVSAQATPEVIETVLAQYNFDVLHFHEPWVPIVSRQILSKSRALNIATFHAKLPDTLMSRTIEKVITPYTRSILKYVDVYTAVSSAAAEYIRTLTDESVSIIPNGIDLTAYTFQDAKGREPNTILYIGRLEKRKGVKFLIKAFRELQASKPDVCLKIVGDGPEREKLEELSREWGLRNVTFLGFVSEDQKQELLSTASVFCSPARYGESFGIVLLEAMASGTPIVAGDNPGYEAVLQGQGRLSVVNPKDQRDFARRLALFLEEGAVQNSWRTWAKSYVQQFDYREVVTQYLDLYEQSLK